MLNPSQEVELLVEKPAAGGRMIARHEGQVVFVLGAIPGETVVARVERVERQLAFASVSKVLDASADRREAVADPLCGGCVYSHITYTRQLALKSDVIADAFLRLGRIPLEQRVQVVPSPEEGYRMRARFHVQGRRVGFFAERSHVVCDALPTRQLTEASVRAATSLAQALLDEGAQPASLELTENLAGDQRAIHVELNSPTLPAPAGVAAMLTASGITGCVLRTADNQQVVSGVPYVADPLRRLVPKAAGSGDVRRGPQSFFQANRFLLPELASAVVDGTDGEGGILDLYAGVGLFAATLAASGRTRITAVEGSRTSSEDLRVNAAQFPRAIRVLAGSVEQFLQTDGSHAGTIIVDPPRSGISRDAMNAVARRKARRIIYVSCDPATMARDARRLVDAGYRLESLRALDLFPNTPHVETIGIFDDGS